MIYYYFNPFDRQYLFPKGYEKHAVFKSFYQAYTFKGKLIWWIWRNIFLIRKWCQVAEPANIVPISELNPYFKNDTLFAFNRGTLGKEQKTSILAIDSEKHEYFIKYATTEISRKNVSNEGEILKQLVDLDFVPQLKQYINETKFTFIQTSVLKGERVVNQNIEQQLLSVLCKIAQLKVVAKNECNSQLKTCFSHGDFCPWNMMLCNNELQIFDWEMGGIQPVGYDLFTYIFQTSFLLTPSKTNSLIIEENKAFITSYFKSQKIENWFPYLFEFSTIKLNLELEKNSVNLLPLYKELNNYAQKF